jgi:predicted flap endonuclease-1-like 5' DNA nuclease
MTCLMGMGNRKMRRLFRLILILMIGYYVTKWWLDQQKKQSAAPVKAPPPVKSQAPSSIPTHSDPLTEIDGIGPAYERALNALDIHTFAQLAVQNPDDLAARLSSVRVTAARIKRDQWIEQAAARINLPASASARWSANDGNSA